MVSLESLRIHFLGDVYQDFRPQTVLNPNQKIITRDAGDTVRQVVFHCADEEGWSPERLSSFFVYERKFPICAYHYYVTDTNVWQMVGENIITYHAAPWNTHSVAFSIDYFASRDDRLNIKIKPTLYENALRTAAFLCIKFHILPRDVLGHRELLWTGYTIQQDHKVLRKTCPGLAINLNTFRYQVSRKVQEGLNALYQTNLVVDGIIGPKTVKAYSLIDKF